jgi:hypothetical protein
MAVARHTKKARLDAHWLARIAGVRPQETARLAFEFHPPIRPGRPADCANVAAALKAAIDGLADALGLDDARIAIRFPETLAEPVRGGAVMVEVTA